MGWFVDLAEARRSIEAWRIHYNTIRPHSSLGFFSPEQFRLAGERGSGKAGRFTTEEHASSDPLSPATTAAIMPPLPHSRLGPKLGGRSDPSLNSGCTCCRTTVSIRRWRSYIEFEEERLIKFISLNKVIYVSRLTI